MTTYATPPIKASKKPPHIKYDDVKHRYWIDGEEVPSVSKILESVTPKDALPWWGMRVGLSAVVKLLQEGELAYPVLVDEVYEEILSGVPSDERGVWRGRGKYRKLKTRLEAAVLDARLSTNHIKDDAAERGTAVHAAVEEIGTHDRIPELDKFPVEYRGYIRAISRWWLEQEPEIHRQEVIVGSRKHVYAGRFDLDCTLPIGRALTDFKTSKGVYGSHFEQLRLYELADRELAKWDDTVPEYDHLVVVHLMPDGSYEQHLGDHVSRDTAINTARLFHSRAADQARIGTLEGATA